MSSVLNDNYDCDTAYSIIFSFTLKNKKKTQVTVAMYIPFFDLIEYMKRK